MYRGMENMHNKMQKIVRKEDHTEKGKGESGIVKEQGGMWWTVFLKLQVYIAIRILQI